MTDEEVRAEIARAMEMSVDELPLTNYEVESEDKGRTQRVDKTFSLVSTTSIS